MHIINSFISNIQLSKININRRGKDVNLWLRSFGIVPSFVCETVEFIYNVLWIKKVIFLTLKKMVFFLNIIGEIIQLQYMSGTKRKEKIGLVDFRDFKM